MIKTMRHLSKKNLIYKSPNPKASEFEVDNWALSKLIQDHISPVIGSHPFPLNELILMTGAVARFRPKLIFEWGTHVGKSAYVLHKTSELLGIDAVVHSIDLPDEIEHVEHPHKERGRMVRKIEKVKLHQGDGLSASLEVLRAQNKNLAKGERVLFFIDGDHSYDSVKRELSGIIKNVPKAAILLHDTFYQSSGSKYNIGPYEAINDCLKSSRRKYKRVDTATGLPGMTLLYPA